MRTIRDGFGRKDQRGDPSELASIFSKEQSTWASVHKHSGSSFIPNTLIPLCPR